MWHLVFQINPIFRVFEVDTLNSLRILGLKWIIVVRLFLFRWNSMMTTIGYSSLRDGEEAKRNILPAESSFWAWCDDTMSVNLNDLVPFWDNIQPPIQSNLWDFYISFIHYFRWWRRGLDEDRRHACYKLCRHRLIWVL